MSLQREHLYFLVLDCLGLSVRKLQVHLPVQKHTCTMNISQYMLIASTMHLAMYLVPEAVTAV